MDLHGGKTPSGLLSRAAVLLSAVKGSTLALVLSAPRQRVAWLAPGIKDDVTEAADAVPPAREDTAASYPWASGRSTLTAEID